jgi:hypothetical protein
MYGAYGFAPGSTPGYNNGISAQTSAMASQMGYGGAGAYGSGAYTTPYPGMHGGSTYGGCGAPGQMLVSPGQMMAPRYDPHGGIGYSVPGQIMGSCGAIGMYEGSYGSGYGEGYPRHYRRGYHRRHRGLNCISDDSDSEDELYPYGDFRPHHRKQKSVCVELGLSSKRRHRRHGLSSMGYGYNYDATGYNAAQMSQAGYSGHS